MPYLRAEKPKLVSTDALDLLKQEQSLPKMFCTWLGKQRRNRRHWEDHGRPRWIHPAWEERESSLALPPAGSRGPARRDNIPSVVRLRGMLQQSTSSFFLYVRAHSHACIAVVIKMHAGSQHREQGKRKQLDAKQYIAMRTCKRTASTPETELMPLTTSSTILWM